MKTKNAKCTHANISSAHGCAYLDVAVEYQDRSVQSMPALCNMDSPFVLAFMEVAGVETLTHAAGKWMRVFLTDDEEKILGFAPMMDLVEFGEKPFMFEDHNQRLLKAHGGSNEA